MPIQDRKVEEKNLLLSIVIPIYMVESYLRKCIDSLLNQNLYPEEYEIILVDDGSPDNCGTIADEYAAKFSNIRVIHQKNGGLGCARNTGIRAARGKYIQFVDSDDYLEPYVLKDLVDKMDRENLDILRFNYQNVNDKYEVFQPNKNPKQFVDYRDDITDGLNFLNERLGPACYVVQFILKTDLVKSQPLFKEGIYFEDTEWTPRIISSAKRVTSTDLIVYNYLSREGSITKAANTEKRKKVLEDSISIIDNMIIQKKEKRDERWYNGVIAATTLSVLGQITNNFYTKKRSYINRLKNLNIFPISDFNLNKGALRKRAIINISPYLFCFLMHIKRISFAK